MLDIFASKIAILQRRRFSLFYNLLKFAIYVARRLLDAYSELNASMEWKFNFFNKNFSLSYSSSIKIF